jgi:xanthosine utilization system XapX-like protein
MSSSPGSIFTSVAGAVPRSWLVLRWVLSTLDAVVLVALAYALIDDRGPAAAALAVAHGGVLLLLLSALVVGARRRWCSWRVVALTAVLGAAASIASLRRSERRG